MKYDILEKFLTIDEYNNMMNILNEKQRTTLIKNDIFIKIGKNSDELFFDNLKNEITLYKNNSDNDIFPKIIYSYVDDEYCCMVLEKIDGLTLSNQRNDYDAKLSYEDRKNILNKVFLIKDLKVDFGTDKKYDRQEKAKKYFERSEKYLDDYIKDFLINNLDLISQYDGEYVISHGDLINTNIMLNNGKPKILDWEFIGYRPISYDSAYFLLFSKDANTFDNITDADFSDGISLVEVYKDAILICLKEIQNFAKLYGKINDEIVNSKIARWNNELKKIIDKYNEIK